MFEARFQTFDDLREPAAAAAHVVALRAELKRRGLDGFVVPRADRQQNEYLPASEERLAWLTGFTGSAGLGVVLAERAVLFVDGRYTVQAGSQVDGKLFAIEHLVDSPPEQWLEQNLKSGVKLGYDPWLHTTESVEKLRKACATAGAELLAVSGNPIDALWSDRPAPPAGPVSLRDVKLAGESAPDKLKRVQGELKKLRAEALVVSDPQNVAWAFNIRGADVAHTPIALAFAIIPHEGKPALYLDGAKLDNQTRHALEEIASVRAPAELTDDVAQLKGKTVRLDQASAADALTRLVESSGGRPLRGADPITLMKAVKNHAEIAGTRAAHKRDGVAMARFLAWLAREAPTGIVTEIDAVEALESFRRDTGVLKDISFATIAGVGTERGDRALPRHPRQQPHAQAERAVFGRFRRAIRGRHHRHHPHHRHRRAVRGNARPLHPRAQGPHCHCHRDISGEYLGRAARPAGAHRAVAGRARFRSRHRPRRRQLSIGT